MKRLVVNHTEKNDEFNIVGPTNKSLSLYYCFIVSTSSMASPAGNRDF